MLAASHRLDALEESVEHEADETLVEPDAQRRGLVQIAPDVEEAVEGLLVGHVLEPGGAPLALAGGGHALHRGRDGVLVRLHQEAVQADRHERQPRGIAELVVGARASPALGRGAHEHLELHAVLVGLPWYVSKAMECSCATWRAAIRGSTVCDSKITSPCFSPKGRHWGEVLDQVLLEVGGLDRRAVRVHVGARGGEGLRLRLLGWGT